MHEIYVYADVSYDEVYYDCYSSSDGKYYYADDEDITVVSRPDDVDYERLSKHLKNMNKYWGNAVDMNEVEEILREVIVDTHKPGNESKNRRKSKSRREQIDDLLIELYDVNQLIKNFGEHEDDDRKDRKYILRKNELEAKLKEIVEEGERG